MAAFASRLARSPPELLMTEGKVFSRLVRVDALPRDGQVVTIEATPAEREELASFYRLPAIAVLTATLRLEPWGRGGARVTGAVHGELTQVCVVSLEPFPAIVDEEVDVRFAPQKAANSRSRRRRKRRCFRSPTKTSPIPSSTEKSISALSRRSSSLSASILIRASPARSWTGSARIQSRRTRHLRRSPSETKRARLGQECCGLMAR